MLQRPLDNANSNDSIIPLRVYIADECKKKNSKGEKNVKIMLF